MQLTERQNEILRYIVELYIATARPVGSAAIVSAGLRTSSATVRNEMAVLEEAGLIRQLHTSGGRVPTNAGYQYYVQHLMQPAPLARTEASTIRHQFHQAHSEVHEWLKLAAAILAGRVHNVGLVTAPRSLEMRLRHLELISMQGVLVLVIVVAQDGRVLQEMMALPEPRTQEELSAQADRLARQFQGRTAAEIAARLDDLPPDDDPMVRMAVHLLQRAEDEHAQVYHAGLADMMEQPEFVEHRPGEPHRMTAERLRHMVEFLQQGHGIERVLARLPHGGDVHVVIGAEQTLNDYSLVVGQYGEPDSRGFVGVVGPTRMQYPRAVTLVRYMTALMTDLLQVQR